MDPRRLWFSLRRIVAVTLTALSGPYANRTMPALARRKRVRPQVGVGNRDRWTAK